METSYAYFLLPVFLLILAHLLNNFLNGKGKLPPGPAGLPILGNLLALGDRPHESLTKLAKVHGPLMSLRLGYTTTIVASSVEMATIILQKNSQAFLGRFVPHAVTAETDYDRSIAWLSGGPKWRTLRKIANSHLFTVQRLDLLQDLRHQMMEGMVKRVLEASEAKEEVNIGRLVFGTTLNLLSNTIFSDDMLDAKSNAVHELKDLLAKIMLYAGQPNLSDYFPLLKPFDLQGIKRNIKVSYDRLHRLIENVVEKRLANVAGGAPKRGDFLDVLIDSWEEEEGLDKFDRRDANILLADLFIGGTDTITTTMEWAMTELLRHPDIMAAAKQELTEKVGLGNPIEEKHISHLPYLQSVIKESMRLHITAPFLVPHSTMSDVEICGYTLPKDTQVLVNAWALARDPGYWDDPTSFRPDRFVGSEDVDFRGTNLAFVPFGSGRRICPGLTLAVRMLSLLLGSLIHHFEWTLPNGMKPEEIDTADKFGITLQKAIPLVAIPRAV